MYIFSNKRFKIQKKNLFLCPKVSSILFFTSRSSSFFLSLCVCLYFIFHSDLAVFPTLSWFVENLFGVFVACLE